MTTNFNAREFQYADQLAKYVNVANEAHPGAMSVVAVMMTPSGSLLLFSNDLTTDDATKAIEDVHADYADRGRGRGLESITAEERDAEAQRAADEAAAAKKADADYQALVARQEREEKIRAEVEAEVRARMDAEDAKA